MTRILRSILLLIAISVTIISCKDSGSPQSITELFLISINKLDFETANYLGTKNTRAFLRILKAESNGAFTQEQLDARAENFEINILEREMTSDTTATVYFSTTPEIFPFDRLHLVLITEKLDKKSWKVDLSTVDIYQQINKSSSKITPQEEGAINTGQFHPEADSIAVEE